MIFVTLHVASPSRRVARKAHERAAIRQDLTHHVTLLDFEGRHLQASFVRRS